MVASTNPGESYSNPVAFIYVFNLIVGVGAINLPSGFQDSGLILGILFLAFNAFLAFITVTWINEAQAIANAVLVLKDMGIDVTDKNRKNDSIQTGENIDLLRKLPQDFSSAEGEPLLSNDNESKKPFNIFTIKQRVEVGLMSELFLGQIGQKIFYAILVIYLFGDLAIYAVTIPKSLSDVTGGWASVSDDNVYYVYLTIFSAIVIPLSMFNFQKTKILQLATLATRNISLLTMIILSLIQIGQHDGVPSHEVPLFHITALPSLFGVSIYAFMCHHSLPSLLTPVKDKSKLNTLMGFDFIAIFIVYGGLCISALFAFGPGNIQSLYTLNFKSYHVRPIGIFLALYPVFTLTTNFPLIAITLRNNLLLLIPFGEQYPRMRQVGFALLATLPPIGIAFATRNVKVLVSITGSYAGLGIMLVMPAFLIIYSRRKIRNVMTQLGIKQENPHASPFASNIWIGFILVVSVACVALATVYQVTEHVGHKS